MLQRLQRYKDCKTSDEDRERIEECYRLLLDAGSDTSSVLNLIRDLYPEALSASAFRISLLHGTLVRRPHPTSLCATWLIVSRPG